MEKNAPFAASNDSRSLRRTFIDKGLSHVARMVKTGFIRLEPTSAKGFLQKTDARAKVFLLLFFIGIVSSKQTVRGEVCIGILVFALAAISRLNLDEFYRRVFFFGFVFGFLIALPASLNIVTQGTIILRIVELPRPVGLWGYYIPQHIGVTLQGMTSVVMLTLRVMNSIALSWLVMSTTRFTDIIKALKMLRVPDVFLLILALTHKYMYIFALTIEEMYLARKSRVAGRVGGGEGRAWVAGRMAVVFKKTQLRCDEIFRAMISRGFSSDVKFYGHEVFGRRDWPFTVFVLFSGIIIILL